MAVSTQFNHMFQTRFFEEFTPENPSENPILASVSTIAINCLYTGVLILHCHSPSTEICYRQIPREHLAELRIAADTDLVDAVDCKFQQIVKEMRDNPELYYPKPFSVLARDNEGWQTYVFAKVYFQQFRHNYSLDNQGMPNTPFSILDMAFYEFEIEKGEGTFSILIKGAPNESEVLMRAYFALSNSECVRYQPFIIEMNKCRTVTNRTIEYAITEGFIDSVITEVARPGSLLRQFLIEFDHLLGDEPSLSHWTILCNAARSAGKILI